MTKLNIEVGEWYLTDSEEEAYKVQSYDDNNGDCCDGVYETLCGFYYKDGRPADGMSPELVRRVYVYDDIKDGDEV